MPTSLNNESKNSLSISNEAKPTASTPTWEDMAITWDEATTTWEQPGTPIVKESKNSLSISNEAKN